MTDTDDLRRRLTEIAVDIERWRSEATEFRAAMTRPDAATNDAVLLSVEETSGAIYRAIAAFDELTNDVDRKSHIAAGQIAEVGDALRLVLMEITELGTRLYSLRSSDVAAEASTSSEGVEFAMSSNGDTWLLYPVQGDGQRFVEHRGNEPSGGAITRVPVETFLEESPRGPQHESLRQLLQRQDDTQMPESLPR